MAIRWTSAARFAGLGLAVIAAFAVLASALEPPGPPPVPDVGLGPSASSPATPSAGEERPGGAWDSPWSARADSAARRSRTRPDTRAERSMPRRSPRPKRERDEERDETPAPTAPAPPPAPPTPQPPAVAYQPALAPPPPAPSPAPAPPPTPPEFGFER
jgi:hypothetical protein